MAAVAAGAVALAGRAEAAQVPSKAVPPPPPPAAPGEPIVPDDQFQKELPPLDPDLTRPLEPIDAFKGPDGKPLAAPVVAPDGTLPPVTAPADPALTEPLAPLSTFDVTTPPPAAKSGNDDEAKVEPVRYTLVVEGLKEVGLEGRFRSLSALEDADGKATNGAMIAARAREDELLAVRMLRSEGYYDATALSSIEQLPETPGQIRVVITTVPGARYSLGAIAIQGPETVPAGLPREALPLKSGDPIVAAEVEAAEANVRLRLPQQGYPFAEVGLRDILLDPDSRRGDYTLPVDPGPRSTFAGFTTEGKLAFDAKHVGVLARFKRGELYDSRKVDDLREAMVATGLFRTVAAEPVRTGEKAPDGTEYVNIRVRQEAGPARSLSGTAGYSTGQGLRLEGSWEHRNFFPPEGALRVSGVAGTQEQSLAVAFHRMNAGKRDRSVLIEAEAGRRDLPAFKGYTVRLHGLVSRESTPIWQKKWTWAYGGELIATNENRTGFPPISLKTAYFLAGLVGQLGYDASNSLLDPTKGFRLTGRINPETSLRKPTQPYIRNIIDGSVYYPATKSLTIAARTRVGSIFGASLAELAPSRRLYGGGGGSVRGFGYQQLGPKAEIANPKFDPTDPKEKDPPTIFVPTGGRSQVEFALEGRYRFGNYGVVAFVDAGQVYESQFPRLSDMRYGIGIGGRFYTNFGPFRADFAVPLGRRKGESKFAVYVSIGQAF
ncbi:MAG: translocation and assembly module TamA [Sphingomonadales bacterium]|jgi:translocation and assembly module TamA|nr:translocation and assembly module TamA [Sphingomonadales bacterium]